MQMLNDFRKTENIMKFCKRKSTDNIFLQTKYLLRKITLCKTQVCWCFDFRTSGILFSFTNYNTEKLVRRQRNYIVPEMLFVTILSVLNTIFFKI